MEKVRKMEDTIRVKEFESKAGLTTDEIMVSVVCLTYNHEYLVSDALDGILKQKTNFKFEILVHDDASTDHTQDVIKAYERKYPMLIRPIYQKENQMKQCNILSKYLYPKARGKYLAFCEGDDFWTAPDKLQRQVDFLESHSDYSLCMHNAVKWNYETNKKINLDTFEKTGTYDQKEQILAGLGTDFPAFASYVCRTELVKKMPEFFTESSVDDYSLRQYLASVGKVYYFEESMSVYRVSTPASYMKTLAKDQSVYNKYTVEMIRFFHKFDIYTNQKFHDIINRKIVSDYLGYCVSIPQKEGSENAQKIGLNEKTITECYKLIANNHVPEMIYNINEQVDHLLIYGTSRLAMVCKSQLEHANIAFDGYVISDGKMKLDSIDGRDVYALGEAVQRFNRPGFILAVQPVNAQEIREQLMKYNVVNYCEPYAIEIEID